MPLCAARSGKEYLRFIQPRYNFKRGPRARIIGFPAYEQVHQSDLKFRSFRDMQNNYRIRLLLTALIFVAALYRYWPLDYPLGPCHIGYESLAIACSLAQKGTFSDPFMFLDTGPSAHVAPLFPLAVSVLVKWLGDTPAVMNALQWIGTFLLAFQLSLWPWFAERLSMGFAAGVVGAGAWIFVGFIVDPMWEAAYVAFLVLVLAICFHRILSEQVSTLFASLTGALAGIIFLLNPVAIVCHFALACWAVCVKRIRVIQKLALLVIPVVVISPWLLRNYEVFHHFILIRDNLGLELSITNNPCTTFGFKFNRWTSCYNHPNESVSEARQVLALGEYAYNQAKLHEALAWIRNNPARFADLTRQRFFAFWFYSPRAHYFAGRNVPGSILIIWAVVPLSLGGLWLLFKKDRIAAGLCLVWLVLFPPIYYFLAFIPRYRYPILWASFMPAAFLLSEAAQAIWQRVGNVCGGAATRVLSSAKLTVSSPE